MPKKKKPREWDDASEKDPSDEVESAAKEDGEEDLFGEEVGDEEEVEEENY